jgi:O-antigen ligase
LLPLAGAFGFGLDGFLKQSCMQGFQVHNSILQAIIEFGWAGGIALTLLIVISLSRLFSSAQRGADTRFALCSFTYIVLTSLAHGRTSRDIALFALLGLAAGITERPLAPQLK